MYSVCAPEWYGTGLENLPGSSSTVLDALGRVAESYVVPGPRSGELCGAGAA